MAYNLSWHEWGKTIRLQLCGDVDLEEVAIFDAAIIGLLHHSPQAHINLIWDVSEVRRFPLNTTSLSRKFTHVRHPSCGVTVMVGAGPMMTTIGHLLTRNNRKMLRLARNWQQAEVLVSRQYPLP